MGLRANPTYRQRRFGAEVRKLRERAGLSVNESAAVMGMNQSHISSVETGRTGLSEERLRKLAAKVGGISATYVDALAELGRRPDKGWWSSYRDQVRPSLLDLAELEDEAAALVCYEPMFVPGLIQTRDYATAIHRGGYVNVSPEVEEAAVDFRMKRQAVLTGEGAPSFHAIIHEAALHPSLGDRRVMRDQLGHLLELARLPNATIQILPFDGPVAFGSSFTLVEPSVRELSTVVVAHVESSLYLGDAESLAKYSHTFARLTETALPPEASHVKDSLGLIQRLLYPLL
ncbi:helix-turn-helix transcriptional regulator [Streptomyces sp. NPDC048483]|uniref:helix-turn-helix domain-containing protein n=1 Tax=Streptomyces sp. NPDC048483 TaxID=3154927 RepID=UPI003416CCC3